MSNPFSLSQKNAFPVFRIRVPPRATNLIAPIITCHSSITFHLHTAATKSNSTRSFRNLQILPPHAQANKRGQPCLRNCDRIRIVQAIHVRLQHSYHLVRREDIMQVRGACRK